MIEAATSADTRPAWVREIDLATRMHPQLIITGNLRDMYLLADPSGRRWPMSLVDAIWFVLRQQGFSALLSYTHASGLTVVADSLGDHIPNADRVLNAVDGLQLGRKLSWDLLRQLVTTLTTVHPGVDPGAPVGLIFPDAGRLFDDPLGEDQRTFLAEASQLAYSGVRFGTSYPVILWLIDQPGELPAWFSAGNHAMRTTVIPTPDLAARMQMCEVMLRRIPGFPTDSDEGKHLVGAFAELTHGMHCRAIRDIAALASASGLPATSIADAVRAYRVGVPDNPWVKPELRARIVTADRALPERVLGQPHAVQRTLDLLKRAAIGLGGAHLRGRSGRPRGVLFFAGPTGVGKTELAKAIAEIVFGDENAYLRFDMSEFAAEQNEARLIGAPPGYVGFDAGGELTNGVRSRPFQVILFDEIEKAHPRILDKFLQILDDGRLTDGRGATVHFTESIIVFTTNLGIVVPGPQGAPVNNVSAADAPEVIDAKVREYIEVFFREHLGRPELYNRLREGIVVFDFLRPEILAQIADASITRAVEAAMERAGHFIELIPTARDAIRAAATADGANGGRGVVSAIETILINPLSRVLFELRADGQRLRIVDVAKRGQNWDLEIR